MNSKVDPSDSYLRALVSLEELAPTMVYAQLPDCRFLVYGRGFVSLGIPQPEFGA